MNFASELSPRLLFHRTLLLLTGLLLLAGHSNAQITLYRDKFGVPSIMANRFPDALYGLGYAMAQDNAVQMARNFKQARGRLAEVDGKRQLATDGFLHSLGIEDRAEEKARHLVGEQAELFQSFCAGANRALAEQKGHLPDWIEPFTPTDVLAMAQLINAAFPIEDIAGRLATGVGSNQFAVAPKRSATGHAILSIDPHLPWEGTLAWYEFALYTKDMRFRGVTLSGLPFGIMGHTDRVAWCMTNNDPALFAFFTVQTNPDNSHQYSYHGEWRDFEDVSYTLRYREDGQLKTRQQRVRRTAWGPMLPFRPQAVALSTLGAWELLDEAPNLARARDARQFRDALRPLGFSMWNIVYADTQGHIGYQYNARLPKRDASFNWSKPVPGADPKTKWGDLWALDDLPHVENPTSGMLVNCNSAPWLTPLDRQIKTDWPAYVTTYGHTTRYDRLSSLVARNAPLSLDRAKQIATDTLTPYALKTIAALQRAAQGRTGTAESAQALKILSAWNGHADIDARGCALYYHWLRADPTGEALAQKAESGTPWTTTEADRAFAMLQKAVTDMTRLQQNPDVPWGKIHIKERGAQTVPSTGFHFGGTMSAVVPNSGRYQNGKILCSVGSSFRMIVDLDPKGVRSWSILPYGESQNPAHPHYADQSALHGRGEYKDTHFGPEQARRCAVTHIALQRTPQ